MDQVKRKKNLHLQRFLTFWPIKRFTPLLQENVAFLNYKKLLKLSRQPCTIIHRVPRMMVRSFPSFVLSSYFMDITIHVVFQAVSHMLGKI